MSMADWLMKIDTPHPDKLGSYESLFSTANGRLGVRGTTPWEHATRQPGTYLAGIFDCPPGEVTELVNLPDWTWVRLYLDGREMRPPESQESSLQLDLRHGLFQAIVRLRDETGREARLAVERFVSPTERAAAFMRISVTPLDCQGWFVLATGFKYDPKDRRLVLRRAYTDSNEACGLLLETMHGKRLICLTSALTGTPEADLSVEGDSEGLTERASWLGFSDRSMIFGRHLAFVDASGGEEAAGELWRRARNYVADCARRGYEAGYAAHVQAGESIWAAVDVEIEGDAEAQLALRHAIYQLIGAGPDRPEYSIAAKGLSGPGYRGHVFWDTDVFMLPFFTYVQPGIGRNLLAYRRLTLDGARAKARAKGYPGAMFAWESADTGEETCPTSYTDPETGETGHIWCGERELHITADIVCALDRYVQVTGDAQLLRDFGAEIIFETARFWHARLEPGTDSRFHISAVIGPDEYHESVDDNVFTNAMARFALLKAGELARALCRTDLRFWEEISQRLGLGEEEPEAWLDAAGRVYLPEPGTGLVLEQFRGFFDLEQPVIKQPDVLMLAVTLPGFLPPAVLKANWDYYEPLTDHGSSLSPAIHALVALELGLQNEAEVYFRRACRVDFHDSMGNGADGLHLANLGGIWQDVVHGFAGIAWRDGALICAPRLPADWREIRCTFHCRGSRLRLAVANDHVEITPLTALASPMPVRVAGRLFQLKEPLRLRLPLTKAI